MFVYIGMNGSEHKNQFEPIKVEITSDCRQLVLRSFFRTLEKAIGIECFAIDLHGSLDYSNDERSTSECVENGIIVKRK